VDDEANELQISIVRSSNPLEIIVGQIRETFPVDFVPGWTAAVLFATGELKAVSFKHQGEMDGFESATATKGIHVNLLVRYGEVMEK
jgi:hypothetical protein